LRLLLCVAVTLTTPSVAAVPSNTISCTGAFAADSSHARLVATFGRRNVIYKVIDAGEGFTSPASIIFPDDESRRIEFIWHDEKRRRYPHQIMVYSSSSPIHSHWILQNKIRLGMPLADVEQLNGRPFSLLGLDFGTVQDWRGGALQKKMGACEVWIWFGARSDIDMGPYEMPMGDETYLSSDPAMRAAKPTLDAIELRYER